MAEIKVYVTAVCALCGSPLKTLQRPWESIPEIDVEPCRCVVDTDGLMTLYTTDIMDTFRQGQTLVVTYMKPGHPGTDYVLNIMGLSEDNNRIVGYKLEPGSDGGFRSFRLDRIVNVFDPLTQRNYRMSSI